MVAVVATVVAVAMAAAGEDKSLGPICDGAPYLPGKTNSIVSVVDSPAFLFPTQLASPEYRRRRWRRAGGPNLIQFSSEVNVPAVK